MMNYTDMGYPRFSDRLGYKYQIAEQQISLDLPCNDRV